MDQEKLDHKLETLAEWIKESGNIVFFGGAGVSTESGIPDFRSVDGLYQQSDRFPPEQILCHSFFMEQPEEFYRFYREEMLMLDAKPNLAHRALARLEQQGKLRAVVTQNIDGLHQEAGSRAVLELHGSVRRNYCMQCKTPHAMEAMVCREAVPRCECGGMIRPDVVLYEESLDQTVLNRAMEYIRQADMMIIGGTSLAVYPAAGLLRYYRGSKLILINKTATPMDDKCDLILYDSIGKVLDACCP